MQGLAVANRRVIDELPTVAVVSLDASADDDRARARTWASRSARRVTYHAITVAQERLMAANTARVLPCTTQRSGRYFLVEPGHWSRCPCCARFPPPFTLGVMLQAGKINNQLPAAREIAGLPTQPIP